MQFENWMEENIKFIKDCNGQVIDFKPTQIQMEFMKDDLQPLKFYGRRHGMTTIRLMYALYSAILWDWKCLFVCNNSGYFEYMKMALKNIIELNEMNNLVQVIDSNKIIFNNGGRIVMYSASNNRLKDKESDVVIVDEA